MVRLCRQPSSERLSPILYAGAPAACRIEPGSPVASLSEVLAPTVIENDVVFIGVQIKDTFGNLVSR